ncbi:MAG: hydrogenase 3 maturation endopeptidase HyCI [Candidatus Verstraetearchaeota archaeon]|nr:hydrogenase 3 maturation endopeptidase HyCI [Candidatus Verstraetearchaeota archaeon]
MPFEDDLLAFLHNSRSLVLAGVGSDIRRDDAVGVMVVSRLKGKLPAGVGLIECGTVPENFTGQIKRLRPTHIIFFDAVEMDKEPGFYDFIHEGTLIVQSLSTHKQSLRILLKVLKEEIPGVRIGLVGIQPKTTDFGRGLSRPVSRGLNSLLEGLIKTIGRGAT